MSVSDSLMWRYFELLSFRPLADIDALKGAVAAGRNPRDVKFELGVELVDRFNGKGAGAAARDEFVARFREGAVPNDVPELEIAIEATGARLALVLKEAQLVASTSAGYRMIEQGAVRIDGERVSDKDLVVKPGPRHLLQVGKRAYAAVTLRAKA